MRGKKLLRYGWGTLRGLSRGRPRDFGKLLSGSPWIIKRLPAHDISMVLDTRDRAVSRPILYTDAYEPHVTRAFLGLLTPGTRFVDVGANIGWFTLLAARKCPEGRVWAIEPDPENFTLLRTSAILNGLEDRIELLNQAAGRQEGELFLSDLGEKHNRGARFTAGDAETLFHLATERIDEPVKVPARTVDAVLDGQKADLVKVDVEGHEPEVFAGMEQTIRKHRPALLTEFAPGTIRHLTDRDPEHLLAAFIDWDYYITVLLPDGTVVNVEDQLARVLDFFKGEEALHHVDLLLQPKG